MIPGPFELWRDTFTLRRSASQRHEQVRARADPLGGDRRRGGGGLVLVEGRGEQRPPGRQPRPGQVGVAGGVRRAQRVHGLLLAPRDGRGVGDAPLRQGAERVGGGVERCVGGPPDRHRGVGQQERQHDRVGVLDHLATQPDQGGLAGPAGEGADLGVDVGGAAGVAEDDAERAGGMLVGGHPGRGHRLVGVLLVDDHDQGQHHAHGRAAGLEAVLDERRGDRGRGGVGELDHQGLLQSRPSRASIAVADSGPQPPEGYCSGRPPLRSQ